MPYSDRMDWEATQEALRRRLASLERGRKKDVAEALGISQAVLSQLISGNRSITVDRAHEIARVLGIKLNHQIIEKNQVED